METQRLCHLLKVMKPANSHAYFLIFLLCWPLGWWWGLVSPLKSRVFSSDVLPGPLLLKCFSGGGRMHLLGLLTSVGHSA